jgi:PBSX family phage portal protein
MTAKKQRKPRGESPEAAVTKLTISRRHVPLYKEDRRAEGESLLDFLMKAMPNPAAEKKGGSKQDPNTGTKDHPFNLDSVVEFKAANPYHSACIDVKATALVGLGFVTEKEKKDRAEAEKAKKEMQQAGPAQPGQMGIQEPQKAKGINKADDGREEDRNSKVATELDVLCEVSFQQVLNQVSEDYQQTGNGYIEVVRGDNAEITGLHFLPAKDVRPVIESNYQGHYQISGNGSDGQELHFARFGDRDELLKRFPDLDKDDVSEVIHFREATAQSRWYGMPKWLAAVAGIELFQALHQHTYDFFLNRGVPEFMLFLLGQKLNQDDWNKLQESVEAGVGMGNSHKSIVLNLSDKNMVVQLEKLAMDTKGDDGFSQKVDTMALEIVTAHRVPPLLAGIQIPGKLGAANEIVSAMKAFQALVIGPQQTIFETTLTNTLGNAAKNGGLKLGRGDFELRKITTEMEVESLDTVSRMRQDVNAPQNKERDPKKGLKD